MVPTAATFSYAVAVPWSCPLPAAMEPLPLAQVEQTATQQVRLRQNRMSFAPDSMILSFADVDGGWSAWQDTTCNVTCGDGFLKQERFCNSPAPANNGADCAGPYNQTSSTSCNPAPCPSREQSANGATATIVCSCSMNVFLFL